MKPLLVTTTQNGGPSSDTYVYKDAGGNNQTFTVAYTAYTVESYFACPNGIPGDFTKTGQYLPTKITTPTGATYVITYETTPSHSPNVTGRVAQITLPSGGYESFGYTGGYSGINCSSYVVPTLTHKISDSNGNTGTWTYVNHNTAGPGTNFNVYETDPAGNQTIYTFTGEYQTQAVFYQGTSTVLKTVTTCYKGTAFASCPTASLPQLPITQTDVYTSLGTSSTCASPCANRMTTTFDTYGNATSVLAYDFGASSPTSQTFNVYGQSYINPTTCNAYPSGTNIFNTPCYNHTQGYVNGAWNDVSKTQITYSNGASGAPSGGSLGHPTSISRWVSGSNWLTSKATYNSNGTVASSQDPAELQGNVSTAYAYSGTDGCNDLLVTTKTYPIPAVGSEQYRYDCNGGVMTQFTDVNGNNTEYSYTANTADPLYRIKSVTNPDGGVVSYSYNTGSSFPWSVGASTSIGSGQPTITTTTVLDGLGRAVRAAGSPAVYSSTTDPNNTSTQLRYGGPVYNNLGQVSTVYNPYFSSSDQTYGTTTFNYDALGRNATVGAAYAITFPDGTIESILYNNRAMERIVNYGSNNTPSPTKIFQYDGLGRLTTICEVTNAPQANGVSPSYCTLDIGYNSVKGFMSSNTYDALGNVLSMGVSTRSFVYDGLSRITTATYPESGTTTYAYDSGTAGDLYQRVAPAPNQTGTQTLTTTYSYDTMHRLTGISYSDGTTPNIAYYYDQSSVWSQTLTNPKGRLTSASGAGVVNAVFGYDPMGRVAFHDQCTPLNCLPTLNPFHAYYSYNYIGEPLGGTDYMGITWTNTYNAIGQLQEVTTNWLSPTQSGTIVSGITYNALGEPVSDSRGDGKTESWNYNKDGHGTTYGQNPAPGYNYGFSNTNLAWTGDFLTSSTDNVTGAWTYTYDDFSRVASAIQPGGQTFNYSYDQYGNRWAAMKGPNQFTFDTNNHITDNGVTYDAAGNVTYDGFHSYTYDGENRLKQVDSGNSPKYNYDAFGNRTSQYAPPVYNEYVVDLNGRAITAINPGTDQVYTAEVFAGGRHWVVDNGSALFVGADWEGTSRALMNLSGQIDQLFKSYPWGDNLTWSGYGGSFATTSQYTGKEYDPESGLYHFPARQYAPVQGRWLTPDPAGLKAMDLSNPQSWNRYTYVMNNPITMVDPSGLYNCGDPHGEFVCQGSTDLFPIGALAVLSAAVQQMLGSGGQAAQQVPGGESEAVATIGGDNNDPAFQQMAGQQIADTTTVYPANNGFTFQLGVALNWNFWGALTGSGFAGIAIDSHGHIATYRGAGGGIAAGAGVSGGVQLAGSNGNSVCALGGPFANVSGTAGYELAGTGDYFQGAGDAPGGLVQGGGVTFGVGGGGAASVQVTGTSVHPFGHSCVNGKIQ